VISETANPTNEIVLTDVITRGLETFTVRGVVLNVDDFVP
jgi:hypothetical protein